MADQLRRHRRALALLLALPVLLLVASPSHAGTIYRSPGVPPPGANDPACRSAEHPEPVVLVHGTFEDMTTSWTVMAPALEARGYCVWALDYGHRATDRIQDSAAELSAFVDHVLAATGAQRVSIVGHSQGGMMPRWYLKFLGGTDKVDDLVGLAPSNHGTTNPFAFPAGRYGDCEACLQQIAGSDFLKELNAGDQTPAPVSYTVVETRYDEVVTPYRSAFLPQSADGRVTNVLLQDACPNDVSEHLAIQGDPIAIQWVANALGRPGPADPAFRPSCLGA
jgi:triacylglycerol lipase